MELKGDVFSMDGKRRILIVSFFDSKLIAPRFHPGKSIEDSEAFLMVFCLEA
jgi:hypothetical protein